MQQSPSREANSHLASQEITRLLWNPKVYYCVQKSATIPTPCITIPNKQFYHGEALLAPRPTRKLVDSYNIT
jgi:hypothetical protein